MLKKSTDKNLRPLKFIIAIALLFAMGCDPCRKLAEEMCACLDSSEKIQQCQADLNFAKLSKFFEIAKEPEICEEALKTCLPCSSPKDGQEDKCALYREALKSP